MRTPLFFKRAGIVVAQAMAVVFVLAVGACAGNAVTPTVAVLPGGGKTMAAFNADDIACRDYAASPSNSNSVPLASMGIGNIEVASARRGFASITGSAPSTGAGSVYGGATAQDTGEKPTTQQKYDTAYIRCMFTKGHKVPVSGGMTS